MKFWMILVMLLTWRRFLLWQTKTFSIINLLELDAWLSLSPMSHMSHTRLGLKPSFGRTWTRSTDPLRCMHTQNPLTNKSFVKFDLFRKSKLIVLLVWHIKLSYIIKVVQTNLLRSKSSISKFTILYGLHGQTYEKIK